MLERLRSLLRDKGYDANEIEAVLADNPTRVSLVWARIEAVKAFRALPEAEALAAANKRIRNILRKSGNAERVDAALFREAEEKKLHDSMQALAPRVEQDLQRGDSPRAEGPRGIRADVDAFFEKVPGMPKTRTFAPIASRCCPSCPAHEPRRRHPKLAS
jgi:glycyl-tRNA synthetase beta chain